MDNYEVQSGRLVQTVKKLCQSCVVTFDSSRAPNWVSFQIKDGSTTVTKGSPEFPASDVAELVGRKAESNDRSGDWRFSQEIRIAL